MNLNCKCPRIKCERHGNCDECRTFHSDPEGVVSFCLWAGMTGFDDPVSRAGLKAWLSNDRTPFSPQKWSRRKADA